MVDIILNYLKEKGKTVPIKVIKKDLNIKGELSNELFLKSINKLEINSQVYFNEQKEELSIINKNSNYKVSTAILNSNNELYFKSNSQKYIPNTKDTKGILNNDLVLISTYDNNLCKIIKIIKRYKDKIICIYMNGTLIPYGVNIPYSIKLNQNIKKIPDYSAIIIELNKDLTNKNTLYCNLIDIIKYNNEPNFEEKIIATYLNFPLTFSLDALKEAEKINDKIDQKEIDKRLDLRDNLIFTIDCDNTKDMDDAISIKRKDNGHYELGVHIAHVSHYIRPNSLLWKEAYERGTSVYMPNSVLPMLPQKLSNDICSLNPNKDRLTLSTIMDIDENGNLVDYIIIPSIINSKRKMKYSEVNELLENNNNNSNFSKEEINSLKTMYELSKKIEKLKDKRGCISFSSNELEIIYDDKNNPIKFKKRDSKAAEKLIENFMIYANESVAKMYSWMPFIYRIHDIPNQDKLNAILEYINTNIEPIPIINNISNRYLQNVLKSINNKDNYEIISNLILPSMSKALFSSNNIGHFGLALEEYSQSTSPIRRFNDLYVQHLIEISNIIDKVNCNDLEKEINKISIQCSKQEQKAEKAEKMANNVEMAKYMKKHIGEEMNGTILYISQSNITVRVDNNVTGFISVYNNPNLYNDKINIGDRIKVKVVDASPLMGLISFDYIEKIKDKKQNKIKAKKKLS